MSKRTAGLQADELSNRTVARHAPAAGTTAAATVAPGSPIARVTVNTFMYSVTNKTAAALTFTGQITDASIGGTVLADFDFQVAAGATASNAFTKLNVPGVKGNAVLGSLTGPSSSVVQKVGIATWTDSMVNG